jgi:hypothetical protein
VKKIAKVEAFMLRTCEKRRLVLMCIMIYSCDRDSRIVDSWCRHCSDPRVTTADELANAIAIQHQIQLPASRPLPTLDNEGEVVKDASRYMTLSLRCRSEVSINLYSLIVCITGAYHKLGTRRYIASQYTQPPTNISANGFAARDV